MPFVASREPESGAGRFALLLGLSSGNKKGGFRKKSRPGGIWGARRTRRGVTLGTSTREETERIYGKPREGMQYPGIHFYYNRYGKRTVISEIDILEKKGIRQCEVKDDNPRPRTGIVTAPAN